MKKLLSTITLLLTGICAWASTPVSVVLADGMDDPAIKQKMERTMSVLLTEANAAYDNHGNLNYGSLGVSEDVQTDLSSLWENSPFICVDDMVVEHCLTTGTGYQVRNIPLELVEADEDDRYHEAVVNFDKKGNMTSFHLSISMNLYMNVVKSNMELTDLRRRQLILDWVEQFRTAYNQKDKNFLETIFSDDALIITGKYVERGSKDGVKLPPKVEIYKKTKRQYLDKLFEIFDNSKRIHVTFDDIDVLMHPVSADYYGVTLHQGYTSDSYHDEGFLFLLWDFENESRPQIHVRAWQPDKFQGKAITEKEKIKLEDFDI